MKRFLAAIVAGLILVPVSASAITLTQAGQVQLAQLAQQLVTIFTQISQAQTLGTAYTQSAAFQTQAITWTTQLSQIQQQLAVLLTTAIVAPSPTPTSVPTIGGSTACPNFYRSLSQGDSGSDVAAMQLFLARDQYARYTGGITGNFDFATLQAVQRFQANYNIVSYGSPETTGYGKVGPATRASMTAVCQSGSYIITTPPITVPVSPSPTPTPLPTPPPVVQTTYSTGQLQLIPELTGQSGGPNSVTFRVNMLPNSSCTSAAFILAFGDGQQQALSSNASCGNQIVQVPHVYPNTGNYTATLTSGSFQTTLQVQVQAPNNTVTLSVSSDSNVSYKANITATYNPGVTCASGAYTVNFGDNTSQSISFGSGCTAQTQAFSHTYSGVGPWLISASDSSGRTVTTNFTGVAITSAGSGDPFQVLFLHGDGVNNGTVFTDSSPKVRTMTASGGVVTDTTDAAVGSASIRFNGSSYLSTPASEDFNFGSGAFTLDFWFKPASLPAAGQQAALVMQAGSTAADNSLGGMGLELFGNQLYFVGRIGNVTYHPYYNNSVHTGALNTGNWYHVALVRSGNAITLYLNGVPEGGIVVSGSANASQNAFTLGRYGEFNGNYYNGRIDEVNIAKGLARWTSSFIPPGLTGSFPEFSDATWLTSLSAGSGWQNLQYDDSSWTNAIEQASYNAVPWSASMWYANFPSGSPAKWIWYRNSVSDTTTGPDTNVTAYFRKVFISPASSATLYISADDSYTVYLNGTQVGTGSGGSSMIPVSLSTTAYNTLAVSAKNNTGPVGLLVDLR